MYNASMKKIILTTSDVIQGKDKLEYVQIITSETVVGVNFVRDFFAGITDILGGRSKTLENALKDAREECLRELEERGRELDCDAIVGVSIETQISNMVTVTACGTAVRF
jgi:uncharacterized protein YbjQ (UPF0145 family)